MRESPGGGSSMVFARGPAPGDSGVPEAVLTSFTSAYFSISSDTDRGTADYYLRVKALDQAGNWGPSRLFRYNLNEDLVAPTASITAPSAVQGPEGQYLGVESSVTLRVVFDKDMKEDTVLSTANVTLQGRRDNTDGAQTEDIPLHLSYDPVLKTLLVSPVDPLTKGWLYTLTVATGVKDLGGNALQSALTADFEVLMDKAVDNRVVAADDQTIVTVPAGALPEDVSITVSVISGGVMSPPRRGKGVRGWHSPQFVSMNTVASANRNIAARLGPFAQPVAIREFIAVKSDGTLFKSNFNKAVTVAIPYLDRDGDGYVDGTSPRVRVKNVTVFGLDESNGVWHKVPSVSLDSSGRTVSAGVWHFSVYATFGVPDNDVSYSYAYPVPFEPALGHARITFASLPTQGAIRVYTASGRKVWETSFLDPDGEKVEWDAVNSSGEKLGSDVYVYIIQSADNKKTGKLVIIR